MRRRSPFAIKLSIVFLSCCLIFLLVLIFLWSFLSEYEKTNPQNPIQEYVTLIKKKDYQAAMEFAGVAASQYFSVAEYERYVKEQVGSFDTLTTDEVASENPKERHFELKGDGDGAIKFILTKSDETLKFNFSGYQLKQAEIEKFSYTIDLPKGKIPVVNGVALKPDNIIEEDRLVAAFDSLKDKTLIPTTVRYQVEGLVFPPEISVVGLDENSYICNILPSYAAQIRLIPDVKSKEQYEALAVNTAKAYAKYISRDIEWDELKAYVNEKTSFFSAIKAYSNVWTVEHNAPVFENLTVKNTVEYSKAHFQTEVSFDYIITKGKLKKVYPTKYILSFAKVGNDFKLANLESL